MEAASSSVGGRNEADSMATARVEEGTKQPDVGSSVIAKRFRSLRRKNSKRRLRVDSERERADTVGTAGGVGGSRSAAVKESL